MYRRAGTQNRRLGESFSDGYVARAYITISLYSYGLYSWGITLGHTDVRDGFDGWQLGDRWLRWDVLGLYFFGNFFRGHADGERRRGWDRAGGWRRGGRGEARLLGSLRIDPGPRRSPSACSEI